MKGQGHDVAGSRLWGVTNGPRGSVAAGFSLRSRLRLKPEATQETRLACPKGTP